MLGLFRKKSETTPPAEPATPDVVPPQPETAKAQAAPEAETGRSGWFDRLKAGLKKTGSQLEGIFGLRRIDESLFEDLETALLSADAGVEATEHLLSQLRERSKKKGLETASQLKDELRSLLVELLEPLEATLEVRSARPFVIMMTGVNGTGKTTSIGKLARFFLQQNLSVLLAAGDTFRAAAREQLAAWGERNGVQVISQQEGDSAAVIFDAIQAGRARNIDVVLADTAGRLPTQLHLMEELRKVKRVAAKAEPAAPQAIWLVLDANTGQNALTQFKAFDDALGLTGLILTKLDGTAKGGVIAAIARVRSGAVKGTQKRPPVPIVFIGVGEGMDDLRPFKASEFVSALLG
jgi:fused signal recognition particle receptor